MLLALTNAALLLELLKTSECEWFASESDAELLEANDDLAPVPRSRRLEQFGCPVPIYKFHSYFAHQYLRR